jgi:2-C-methyl-D-erythritol 2,4-cyclodiphosphate synthase
MKIGTGHDAHRLVEDRPLILGGVNIPYSKGLLGHSDADVLVHAVCDAVLGALGLGDIGRHFPDTDSSYKDISSLKILESVQQMAEKRNFYCGNVDATIVAQAPKLSHFMAQMKTNIAHCLKTSAENINIKATTTEGMGPEGRGEGISAQAVVLMKKKD